MRRVVSINSDWEFSISQKENERVNVPHTWNNIDGQDGDNFYLRDKGRYKKVIFFNNNDDELVYLEINGAAMVCDVYLNGVLLNHHEGGYSTFRTELTPYINFGNNELIIEVDNSNEHVYPQMADFTFYGGLYRDVNLIYVNKHHFTLEHYGATGMKVTPIIEGDDAIVHVETWQTDGEVEVIINNETQRKESVDGKANFEFNINQVRLWNGREDPYLYDVTCNLYINKDKVDSISSYFGCRSYDIDPERGFILNGKEYPLRGVSRHQDRKDIGCALTPEMHEEDFKLIYDMGANSIRLAHYQHDQYFYDLCDKYGLLVWAEIPYISSHMEDANDNTKTQMKELIIQNYNHPSIVVWGLSNEITMQKYTDDILKNHIELNDLVYSLDNSRKTVIANIGTLSFDNPLLKVSDAATYNIYYGWYLGELKDNDEFFDRFHKENSNIPIGFSEYGCDTNINYHTSNPSRGDYTEEYQCLYHEHILNMVNERKWLWCSYAWNMFDFAADARNEGGAKGLNQKGIVSFDRKIKKDVYYLYKAYWTNEPFIYICGRRYIDRNEHTTTIKVYSNLEEVSLYKDEELIETKKGDKVFVFEVDINSEHIIKATVKDLSDEIHIKYVEVPNEEYVLKGAGIMNWFDAEGFKEDYYSLNDKAACLLESEKMSSLLNRILDSVADGDGEDLIKAREDKNYISSLTNITINDFLSQSGNEISNNIRRHINNSLQQIKKEY